MMQVAKRILLVGGAVLLALVVLAAGVFLFVTRTDPGRSWLTAKLNARFAEPDGSGFRIGRIGGSLPGRVELTDVALSDGQGVWCTISSVAVSWRPLALLSGDAEVELLEIGEVRVSRLPAGAEAAQGKPGNPLQWPTLPVNVTVERFSARDIELAEPALGTAASLRANGRLAAREAGPVTTELILERTDGSPGRAELAAEWRPGGNFLRVAITASEPPGGLIARALAVPDLPPVSIRLAGEGPLTRWRGQLAAALGEAVGADVELAVEGSGDIYELDAAGRVRGAVLLPEAVRPLFADGAEFSTVGTMRGGRVVEIANARVATTAVTVALTGTAQLNPDDLTKSRVDGRAEVAILQPAALQALVGPIDGAGLRLTAGFAGALLAPEIKAHGEAARVQHSEAEIRDLSLDVTVAPAQPVGHGPFRGVLTAVANAGSIKVAAPEASVLPRGPYSVKVESALDMPARQVRVAELRIAGPDLHVSGSGEVNLQTLAADAELQAAAADVTPLSAALGMPVSGAAEVSASLHAGAGFRDARARIAATLTDIASTQAPLQAAFGGRAALDADLTTDAAGVHRGEIRFAAANLGVTAQGAVSPESGQIEAEYRAVAANLSAFSALAGMDLAGRAALSGTVKGPLKDPGIVAALRVENAVIAARPLGRVDARLEAETPATAARGKIELSAAPPSGRTSANAAFAVADGALRLTEARATLEDKANDNRLSVSNGDLRVGPWRNGEPILVEATARWKNEKPDRTGSVRLNGRALIDRMANRYALRNTSLRFEAAGAGLPASGVNGELRGEAAADLATQTARAAVALTLLDAKADAELRVDALSTKQRFRGKLVLHEFNPKALMKRLGKSPPATRDDRVLDQASLEIAVSGDSSGLQLDPIRARLDDSRINGQLSVRNYANPVVRFDIRFDQINLDRYLPPTPGKPPAAGSDDALSSISTESLRELGLDMSGTVRVGRLTLNGDRTDNFVTKIEWDP